MDELPAFEEHFSGYIEEFIKKGLDYEFMRKEYDIDSQILNVFVEFQTMRDKKNYSQTQSTGHSAPALSELSKL